MSARRTDSPSKRYPMNNNGAPWLVMLLVWLLVALGYCFCYGCATTEPPKCEPQIVVLIKKVPVPCTVMITRQGPLLLAEYPVPPGDDPTEEELKEWALEVRRIVKEREAQLQARIKSMEYQIDEHNSDLPDCSEIDTTPTEEPTG